MVRDTNRPLQAWTCIKCGAALPTEADRGKLITCGHCGTSFQLPAAAVRCGGVNISGGAVTIGGDLIGGSKVVVSNGNSTIASSDVAQSVVTLWDDSTESDDRGILIDCKDVRVYGDVVGGSVVKIGQPAPAVKPSVPQVVPAPAPKSGRWEKIKRLFSN